MHQHPFAGGATYLSQCDIIIFSQRIHPIAFKAGVPAKIIFTYDRHARNTIYVNHYPAGHGRLRRRTCSIAQGCPWAMHYLAIISHPWALKLEAMGIDPGVLADDLMVIATGAHAVANAVRAIHRAHGYILDTRALLKPKNLGIRQRPCRP